MSGRQEGMTKLRAEKCLRGHMVKQFSLPHANWVALQGERSI